MKNFNFQNSWNNVNQKIIGTIKGGKPHVIDDSAL